MSWVDGTGALIGDDGPEVWIEFESAERFDITRRDGDVAFEVSFPDPPAVLCGMPPLIPLTDGGVALWFYTQERPNITSRIVWSDPSTAGTLTEIPLEYRFVALDPAGAVLMYDPDGSWSASPRTAEAGSECLRRGSPAGHTRTAGNTRMVRRRGRGGRSLRRPCRRLRRGRARRGAAGWP